MNDAPILRELVRLRANDRVGDEAIDRMTPHELQARPEATVLAIVRGFYEFKSNGYAEADIYREIEGRRAQKTPKAHPARISPSHPHSQRKKALFDLGRKPPCF